MAAELHHAMNAARRVSLIAGNARAIAVQAGEQIAGFKAITNFIDELARSMIAQAVTINRIAMGVSRTAVLQLRTLDARRRFHRATAALTDHLDSLRHSRQRFEDAVAHLSGQMDGALLALAAELDETRRQIRAADIIVTTSKVEAARAGKYRAQLEVIAEHIRQCADEIKTHLSAAQAVLRALKENRP